MSKFCLTLIFSLPLYAQLPPCCQLQTPPTVYNDSVGIGISPTAVAFSPDTNCPLLAVVNTGDDSVPGTTISVFKVNADCTLQAPAAMYTVGSQPMSVAFSPNGNCLAVANAGNISVPGNTISVFAVNSDCTLTEVPGSPFDVGVFPYAVAFSPNINCPLLVVANSISNTISVFTVNPDDCTLTFVDTYDMIDGIGNSPRSVAFSPTGDCLAVANFYSNTISVFQVNPDCTLTEVPGSPFGIIGGGNPHSIAFSPDGTCLVAANINGSTISVFRVNPDDCTLQLPPTTYGMGDGVGQNPFSIAFSPDGTCLAATNQNSQNVSIFRVNPDCTLTFVESPATDGDAPRGLAFSPDGQCLVAINNATRSISVFRPLVLQPTITHIIPQCATLMVMGTANPNVTVTLFADSNFDNPIGSALASGTGAFSVATIPLPIGTHTITAVANNGACVSSLSAPVMATITPLQPPSITSATANCTTLTVMGTAEPNTAITLFADNNPAPLGLGSTDTTGKFSITVSSPLSPGAHTITALAGSGECMSDRSMPFMIINASPVITTVSATCGNTIAVMGISMPNTLITLAIDNVPVTTGITNSDGTFIFTMVPVTPGSHCITITDETSQCISQATCLNVNSISCVMSSPNLAFGTHCNL